MFNESVATLIKQFVNFGIVGISNTAIYLAVYYALLFYNVNYIIAYSVSFVVSVLNAYYWNNKYVFKKNTAGHMKPLVKTFFSYGSTFILSIGLLILMVDYINISKNIAPVINLVITIPLNFLLSKLWAFK